MGTIKNDYEKYVKQYQPKSFADWYYAKYKKNYEPFCEIPFTNTNETVLTETETMLINQVNEISEEKEQTSNLLNRKEAEITELEDIILVYEEEEEKRENIKYIIGVFLFGLLIFSMIGCLGYLLYYGLSLLLELTLNDTELFIVLFPIIFIIVVLYIAYNMD